MVKDHQARNNKYSKSAIFAVIICVALFFIFSTSGCGKSEAPKKGDIVGYVNKEPILKSDLKRDLDLRVRMDANFKENPDTTRDSLEHIIDRKLMLQDAVKHGLARDDRFVELVRTFYEEALLKNFIETKSREFKAAVKVTEQDLLEYYENLKKKVVFKVARNRDRGMVDDLYAKLEKNPKDLLVMWETIGPVGYEELASGILADAFTLPAGKFKKFQDANMYYVIMVESEEPRSLAPFESIKDDLVRRVTDLKERRLFEEWMLSARKNAKITFVPESMSAN